MRPTKDGPTLKIAGLAHQSTRALTHLPFNMAEADVAAWVLLALPPVVFVFIKAVDRWAADQRLRQSVQQRTPSARRGISALERRLELAVADAPASQRGNYRKRLELLMSSAKVNKASYTLLEKLFSQADSSADPAQECRRSTWILAHSLVCWRL